MNKSSKKAVIIIMLVILAGAALAWAAPQWRAAKAAAEVEQKASEFVQFAEVEQITITDEHIIIPVELEDNPQTQAFVANAIAQRNIVEVSNTAITALEHVGVQNGWADAIGSLGNNAPWIGIACVALFLVTRKDKEEKDGSNG